MPKLHEIGSIEGALANSPLSTSKLWWRDVETITGAELHAFIARMGYEGYGNEARHNVEIALDEVRRALEQGAVKSAPMLQLTLPGTCITLGNVRALLEQFSIPRRKALLFAAETRMELVEVITLRWKRAFREGMPELARLVLLGTPRHIRSDLVFWEYQRYGTAMPLIGLEQEYLDLMPDVAWGEFLEMYTQAVPYDYDAELRAFMDVI